MQKLTKGALWWTLCYTIFRLTVALQAQFSKTRQLERAPKFHNLKKSISRTPWVKWPPPFSQFNILAHNRKKVFGFLSEFRYINKLIVFVSFPNSAQHSDEFIVCEKQDFLRFPSFWIEKRKRKHKNTLLV